MKGLMTLNCLLQIEFDKAAASVVDALEPEIREKGSIRLLKVLISYVVLAVLYVPVSLVSTGSVYFVTFIILFGYAGQYCTSCCIRITAKWKQQ
jgi:hypothetical protein